MGTNIYKCDKIDPDQHCNESRRTPSKILYILIDFGYIINIIPMAIIELGIRN